MKTTLQILTAFWCFILLLTACGGSVGDSTGAATRTISGSLSPSESPGLTKALRHLVADCSADTVIATDTTGSTTTSAVDDDCNFSIELAMGKSYMISFAKNDAFVATLTFDSGGSGFATGTLPLSGSGEIGLGSITISGNTAIPANNPLKENDQDEDGQNDFEDQDDDGDEVADEEEEDCDLDGIVDDHDEEDSDCEDEEDTGEAKVIEVKPRNDPHQELGEDRVDLNKDVKARISCTVDQASVTSETFSIVSADGSDAIACAFSFSGGHQDHTTIKCEHDGQDFLPDTTYTATINGVLCEDGTALESRSWSWTTETEDDDEGDGEDDLDDEEDDEDQEEGEDDNDSEDDEDDEED